MWRLFLVMLLGLGTIVMLTNRSTPESKVEPRDLGMQAGPDDLAAISEQLHKEFVEANNNPHGQLLSSEAVEIKERFTESGFAAHIAKVHPISDVQIRFKDGWFEMSGVINRRRIKGFKDTLNMSDNELDNISFIGSVVESFTNDPTFYLQGYGSVTNNVVDLEITQAELNENNVPTNQARDALKTYLELVFQKAPAFNGESISIADGYLRFTGTATKKVPKY